MAVVIQSMFILYERYNNYKALLLFPTKIKVYLCFRSILNSSTVITLYVYLQTKKEKI